MYSTIQNKYTSPGDELTLVNDSHGDVLIVRIGDGQPFPIRKEFVSEVRPVEVVVEPITSPRKPRESNKPLTQAEKLQLEYLKSL